MGQPTPIEWLQEVYKVKGQLKESDFDYVNNWTKENTYTEEQMNSFNERWAFSREQTRHISNRIGFGEGVRLGIAYSEEYYNQLDKTDKDEEDFESDFIDELYESLKQPKKD